VSRPSRRDLIAIKKPVVIAVCMLAALARSGLAAEPLQPEEGPVAEAGGANAAPDTPEAKPEDRADPSTAVSESAGKDFPPACPEGPPCRGE
jgi:hypothetical protein